jgi:hypothetical protein
LKQLEIVKAFYQEFGIIKDVFEILELSVIEAPNSNAEYVWHPGVYVWWHPEHGVIRVGRSLDNSRKRAMEHIRDNTGGIMAELGADERTTVLLFNVIDRQKYYWVAALEIYLERVLSPKIPAGRQG